jgi:hypothetical protein
MTILELDDRFPPGAAVETAWQEGIAAFLGRQPRAT